MIIASVPGEESDTASTTPFPPCPDTVWRRSSRNRSFAAEYGSAQAPFSRRAAPPERSRRHRATRALDGELGSCARRNTQRAGPGSALIG
jgi:hypothetical protein